jgi:hypothetical protein
MALDNSRCCLLSGDGSLIMYGMSKGFDDIQSVGAAMTCNDRSNAVA